MRICNVNATWTATRAIPAKKKNSTTQVPVQELTLHRNVCLILSPKSGQRPLIVRIAQNEAYPVLLTNNEQRFDSCLRVHKVDQETISLRDRKHNIRAYSSTQPARIGDLPALRPFGTTVEYSAFWEIRNTSTAGNMNDRAQTLDIIRFAPSCLIDPQVSHNKHAFGQEPCYSQLSRRERPSIYPQITTLKSHMFEPESTMGRRLLAAIVGTKLWTPSRADVAPAWQVKGPCLGV